MCDRIIRIAVSSANCTMTNWPYSFIIILKFTKSILTGALPQASQGAYNAPMPPSCPHLVQGRNLQSQLPSHTTDIQMKHQVCLHPTMPQLGHFGPWRFVLPPFAPMISWFLHSRLGPYWQMCKCCVTYCNANNAIKHSHARRHHYQ